LEKDDNQQLGQHLLIWSNNALHIQPHKRKSMLRWTRPKGILENFQSGSNFKHCLYNICKTLCN